MRCVRRDCSGALCTVVEAGGDPDQCPMVILDNQPTTKKGLDIINHLYPHPTDLWRNLTRQLDDPLTDDLVATILYEARYSYGLDEHGNLRMLDHYERRR